MIKFNFWVFLYSFNISLLLIGLGYRLLSPFWKALFVSQSEMNLYSFIFFVLLNLIVYGVCYVALNSCALKSMFLE
jgi:hypothetical protein